jgi:hypothetical protein
MRKKLTTLSLLSLLVLAAWEFFKAPASAGQTAEENATTASPPAWLKSEPLIIVGNWDSMPIFRRRVGGGTTWQEDDYRREHSEETVRRLKDLGVTMAIIHFYKGFGLEAEKEHQEDARKLAALLHKFGIRVGVYIGSTIAYETFLTEKPEAADWFVPDFLGKPVFYDDQTFRKRVYFMHPGYREYMKRVLRLAVEDLKVDDIDFDNTSMQAQASIFQHPLAIQDFRDYLEKKYPRAELKKRLGFSDVRNVLPPRWDKPLRTINDPLFQEWADFRCHQLNRYYAEMAQFIRGMNPNVVISTNPHSGISGRNTVWDQGVDYPGLLPYMDIVWTEEGNEAGVTPEGILVSKIRTYKMATVLNRRVLTYTAEISPAGTLVSGKAGGKLQMAESMAYNRQSLGMVGDVLAGYSLPEDQRKYIKFFVEHFEDFRDVDNVADVAVLHSHSSLGFNPDRPWQSAMLFEQVLIQTKVPFDIIFDQNLKDLSKYRVLVLPDQECLNDEQLDLSRRFVNQGGGLVATEHSSLYTEWRQRRRDFGLKDLLKVDAPPWHGADEPEELLHTGPVRNLVGRGRVVYVPEVKPATAKPPTAPMTSEYWKLPVNWEELASAVSWAAGDHLSLEVKAPLTVTAELLEQKKSNRLLVHLLNYDVQRSPIVRNIEIILKIPDGRRVEEISLLSPDEEQAQPRTYVVRDKGIVVNVPHLRTYSLILVRLQHP